ncbi:MAG: alpha/beta hydrolase [Chloroflexi bacterium]|nr:alpha/beta hydrolase [Chloroflexota bacterium]
MSQRSRHLVDPELLEFLDSFPSRSLTADRLPSLRSEAAALLLEQRSLEPAFPQLDVAERSVSGLDGQDPPVRLLCIIPTAARRPMPALVWIHGGGYVLGSPEGDALQMKTLADEAECAIFSVDYRLAPEFPFPAGLHDCYAALCWVHAHASELGVDTGRIAIGGASAGGGLAAALGLFARDRAEVRVAFQMLLVPMLDDRTTAHADPHPFAGELTWTPTQNLFGWTSYLGAEPGGDGVSAYAAPARAESLAGLPPTYIATGALDLFLEEDMEYARRLTRAGVPVELHVYPGAYHGFSRASNARVSHAYRRDLTNALRRAFELSAVAVA